MQGAGHVSIRLLGVSGTELGAIIKGLHLHCKNMSLYYKNLCKLFLLISGSLGLSGLREAGSCWARSQLSGFRTSRD